MPSKVGERCATCKYAKNPHTTKSAVVEVKYLTCWHNLPHECQPWNRCKRRSSDERPSRVWAVV